MTETFVWTKGVLVNNDCFDLLTWNPHTVQGSVPGISISTEYDDLADVGVVFFYGTPTVAGHYTVKVTGYDNYVVTFDITVKDTTKTVTFNANGGSAVASQSVSPGGYATPPANPTNGVNVFGGWFTDQACTQAFNFSTPIYNDITLYAKWITPNASVTSSHGNSTMTVGQLFSYNVSTSPGNATISVSGANWLTVSGHTVYGTPTSPGTYNVTITSSASGYNNGSQSFTVTVSSVLAPSNAPSNGVIAYVR